MIAERHQHVWGNLGKFPEDLSQANAFSLRTLVSSSNFKDNLLALFENLVAVHVDSREVDENVLLVAVYGDEAVAFLSVEPFNGSSRHVFLQLL